VHFVHSFGKVFEAREEPVEEVWINSPDRVFVARHGQHELTNLVLTRAQVSELGERMLKSGRRIDLSQPFVDAMLPEGHRLRNGLPVIGMPLTLRSSRCGCRATRRTAAWSAGAVSGMDGGGAQTSPIPLPLVRDVLPATLSQSEAPAAMSQIAPGRSSSCMYPYRDGGGMTDTRIPPAEVAGFRGALMKRASKKILGEVPTPLGVYWHNQKVLQTTFRIGSKIRKWDACDENLKSFAHLAVASLVGCTWCLDFNYFQAYNENLDLEKAREVPRWRESDVFTALERDVLGYAEAMSQTPPMVTDGLVARLLEQLGAAALVELTSVIAFANFTTRGNVALGIGSDGFADRCELPPLAQPAAGSGVAPAS
jgi:alkylhydroperoxidase family enzyme